MIGTKDLFPQDEVYLAGVSELFNKVMYYKIDVNTKFWQLEKAHKKYFRIEATPDPSPIGVCFAIYAGNDSPWDDMATFDICSAYSEQMALLACLRAAAGQSPILDDHELQGLDWGVRDGLKNVLGVSP